MTTLPINRLSAKRSSQWPAVRAAHLRVQPQCAVCRTAAHLEVHHMMPFHLAPRLELDPKNLLTLCETPGHNCHHLFGHFLNWDRFNPLVLADAAAWALKIASRP